MRGVTLVIASAATVAVGWLISLFLPLNGGVRLRNAFLLRRGRPEDFAWKPPDIPCDFRIERSRAPPEIEAVVAHLGSGSDGERALALVTMLVRNAHDDGAIQADLTTTLNGIIAGRGYCADFVRVYMAAASAAGIFTRQWAFSFDGFGGHGHTFVEIFDRDQGRWMFVDVHNNVYAVHSASDDPLDARTLRRLLVESPELVEFRPAGPGRLGFRHFDKLLDYYCRGAGEWYLWWGNDVISRENTRWARAIGKVSGRLMHVMQAVMGGLPPLMAVATPDNAEALTRMEGLRRRAILAVLVAALLVTLLMLQLALGTHGND